MGMPDKKKELSIESATKKDNDVADDIREVKEAVLRMEKVFNGRVHPESILRNSWCDLRIGDSLFHIC
jgi:hypothetical protein